MKKLVFIIGGQAAGKMTVGEELAKLTGLKLFHNHMTIEIANHFYGFEEQHKDSFSDMRDRLREVVFSNVAKSSLDGVIFTSLMQFDEEEIWETFDRYIKSFTSAAKEIGEETTVYCAELVCDIEERRKRNISANRLEKKPTKRNIAWTNQDINTSEQNHRLISTEEDIKRFPAEHYFKIDNTNLSAEDTAKKIQEELSLPFQRSQNQINLLLI